ncbi:MAG: biotin/lipoyl-binding protein, partial [Verrucomicrobia bacterium]|nr:biotin/lipoyl-binding protein [Verrucomicrobiota bacterium]
MDHGPDGPHGEGGNNQTCLISVRSAFSVVLTPLRVFSLPAQPLHKLFPGSGLPLSAAHVTTYGHHYMILPSRSIRRLRGTFLTRLHSHRTETGSVILWLLVLLFVAGGAALWWRQSKSASKPIDYRTGKITNGEIIQSVSASGQVTPLITVQVGSQVSGIIEKLYVDFNSTVTNGQLLAQLEP